MKNKKRIDKQLLVCLVSLILIVAKMQFFNNIFLILAIGILCIAIIFDSPENKSLYLVFTLPLIYVMKFSYESFTLFNLLNFTYILSMFIIYIRDKIKFRIKSIISLMIFLFIIFLSNLVNDNLNFFSLIGWLSNLITFFFAANQINTKDTFKKHCLYFAISISIIGILGIIFINRGNIGNYLYNMRRTNTVVAGNILNYRYSGFDMDPNYFALQSLIVLMCLLVINKYENKFNYLLIFALLIVGLTTFSKMYLLTLSLGMIYFLISSTKIKSKKSIKKLIPKILLIVIVAIIGINFIFPVFEARISTVTDINSLTTGRAQIWGKYITYISNNFKVLLLGEGMGMPYLNNDAAPHSTYILLIYRLGIIGAITFIAYMLGFIKKKKFKLIDIRNLPLIIFLTTNFALDIFDFDSFVYIMFFVLLIYNIKELEGEKK